MNMSDDVSGAVVQVTTKVAEQTIETVGRAVDRIVDQIAKLLQALSAKKTMTKNRVKSTDLTDIKPGEVSIRDLVTSAKRNRDTLSASEHGLTTADKNYIQQKAKEYGIPVAFTGDKNNDNIYANVRTNDVGIFQRICTEMMKEKLEERPKKLSNFKTQEWEIPFLTAELNKHDLSAQFGKTNSGEYFALYERADEKAILIARGEFVRKCTELKRDMCIDKDEDGLYTIKDLRSGREISFDPGMTHDELSRRMQHQFGYDTNKSAIACAKFGEESLKGAEKQRFFSNHPQNDFSKVDTNITVDGESIYAKPYDCWRVTPKIDGIPKLVFRDANGNFAVLNPEKMTNKQIAATLREHLKIADKETLDALTDKAAKVTDYYAGQDAAYFSHEITFAKSDFDMSNPDVVSGMHRTDADGDSFVKTLPLTRIQNEISRTDKDNFKIISSAQSDETDSNGITHSSFDKQELILSFSDKKNAVAELAAAYRKQGVPAHIASQMAKDVFAKAEAQSAEKILQIEEIKMEPPRYHDSVTELTVKCGAQTNTITLADAKKAKAELMQKFDVGEEIASHTLDRAYEQITEREENVLSKFGFRGVEKWTKDEAHDMICAIESNDWKVPSDIKPDEYVPARLDNRSFGSSISVPEAPLPGGEQIPDIPDMPRIDVPTGGRGGR